MKLKYIRLIREIGDSISVTIPAGFKIFEAGDEVWVELQGDKVIVSKVVQAPATSPPHPQAAREHD